MCSSSHRRLGELLGGQRPAERGPRLVLAGALSSCQSQDPGGSHGGSHEEPLAGPAHRWGPSRWVDLGPAGTGLGLPGLHPGPSGGRVPVAPGLHVALGSLLERSVRGGDRKLVGPAGQSPRLLRTSLDASRASGDGRARRATPNAPFRVDLRPPHRRPALGAPGGAGGRAGRLASQPTSRLFNLSNNPVHCFIPFAR